MLLLLQHYQLDNPRNIYKYYLVLDPKYQNLQQQILLHIDNVVHAKQFNTSIALKSNLLMSTHKVKSMDYHITSTNDLCVVWDKQQGGNAKATHSITNILRRFQSIIIVVYINI